MENRLSDENITKGAQAYYFPKRFSWNVHRYHMKNEVHGEIRLRSTEYNKVKHASLL